MVSQKDDGVGHYTQGRILFQKLMEGFPYAPHEGKCWNCGEPAHFTREEGWVHTKTGIAGSETPRPHKADVHIVAKGFDDPGIAIDPPERRPIG